MRWEPSRLISSFGPPVYQNQSSASSEKTSVDQLESRLGDDSKNLKANKQDGAPTVAVAPSFANSLDALKPSSGQLIIGLAVIFFLVVGIRWFFDDIGDWGPRLRRRFSRWRGEPANWGETTAVDFSLAQSDLPPLVLKESAANPEDSSESTVLQQHSTFPESKCVETVEPEQQNPQKELDSNLQAPSRNSTTEHKSQSGEDVALKHELAEEVNEIEALTRPLTEEKSADKATETRYRKLTDELAESRLAQSQMQTDFALANQSLESLTAKITQAEQQRESAYQELRGKADSIEQLECNLVSSESLADLLEENLNRTQSDLERQIQQTLTAGARAREIEKDALQLEQQLEGKRNGDVEIESLTAKLAKHADELAKLGSQLDETVASADEKAALLEESEARYTWLADELEQLNLAQTELATAQEEILSLSSKAEHAQKEMDSVYQEMLYKGEIVTGLQGENEKLTSTLQQVENQLATVEMDAKQTAEKNQAIQIQLKEEADQHEQSQQELKSELDSARQEIAELQQQAESSATELAQNATKYSEELESLNFYIGETETEKQTQQDENEKLKTTLQQVESQLTTFEVDAKRTAEKKQAIQTQLKEEADKHKQSKQEIESALDSARQEITELKQKAELSESELAKNLTKHAEELGSLKSCLEQTETEKQTQQVENEELKSTLQQFKNQLATVETDAKRILESKQAIQVQLKEETDRNEQFQQELESQLKSAKQEISELHQHAESSQSELAQSAAIHAKELVNLNRSIENTDKENQTQRDENKKLNSIVAQAESELTSANAEIAELKSELSARTASAEQTSAVQEQLKEANAQADVFLKQIDLLSSEIGELKNQLDLNTEQLEAATTLQTKQDEHQAELNDQSKLLQRRANEAELKLAETSKSLAAQQTSYAKLEKSAQLGNDELAIQVSRNSELEASLKSVESQVLETQRKLAATASLLEQEKSNCEKIENTVKHQAQELDILSSGKSNIAAELEPLKRRAQVAERKLEETAKLLEVEQALHTEIKKTSQEANAELCKQRSKALELETSVKSLESQIQAASEKLELTTSELKEKRSLLVELEKTTQQQQTQLSQKDAKYIELEAKLRETVESSSDKLMSESRKLERQGAELGDLRIALQNEKLQRSEILENLEASQIRIAELEQQAEASFDDESNNEKLAQRFRTYKNAYRKNIGVMERLAERKAKMTKLATEYLAVAKILRGQLDTQLAITAELQQKLESTASDGAIPSELNLLVQERARADVMALKTQFEQRIKRKNEIIRKLQS